MRLRWITLVALVAVLAFVPHAFAFSSGGGGGKGGPVSGNFNGYTYSGSCDGNNCAGTFTNGTDGGSWSGNFVLTPEPIATLLVGLGLLGARFLRRK
jgi:hypothetical protein